VDDPIVREVTEPAHAHRGQVLFVRLTCAGDELLARVQCQSRRGYGKLTDR
jgi:hypothetical protein